MILRLKTAVIFLLMLLGLVLFLYKSADTFLLKTFQKLEEQSVRESFQRAQDLMKDDLSMLSNQVGDWAGWDESYEFIENANRAYISRNLADKTFADLKINMIMFIHASGKTVYERWFDQKEGREAPISISIREHLGKNSRLLNHTYQSSNAAGIVILPEGPLLVASRPILTSERTGAIRGTLIMGRYLDEIETDRLAKAAHISFSVSGIDDPYAPSDFVQRQSLLSDKSRFIIQPLSDKEIAGYGLVNDIYGKPVLMLKTKLSRVINQNGEKGFHNFIISMAVAGLIIGVGFLLAMEKTIFSRLASLSAIAAGAAARHHSGARVTVKEKDELSKLAQILEDVLQSSQKSEGTARNDELRQYCRFFADTPTAMYTAQPDGNISLCNPAFARLLGFASTEELLAHPEVSPFQDSEVREDLLRSLKENEKLESHCIEFSTLLGQEMSAVQKVTGEFDPQGKLLNFTGYIIKVVERQTADEENSA